MSVRQTGVAMQALRWTVALVILFEGSRAFLGSLPRLHDPGPAGVLAWVRLILSGSEIVGAPLFLLPLTAAVGGYALLGIIGLAIAIHALHGDFRGLDILVLYGVAVYAAMVWRKDCARPGSNTSS